MPHEVAVLVYDGLEPFELGVVTEIFAVRRPELPDLSYRVRVCARDSAPIRVVGGFELTARHGLDRLERAGTVIVPGSPDVEGTPPPEVLEALRRAHAGGARMVSLCLGAFTLAAAGLLDGREAVTHWQYADTLARRYPDVHVNPQVLYVDDGDVLTSAGSAAGIDLCLHLVRRDHGSEAANALARRMVIAPHRDGGQAQFIERPVAASSDDDRIATAMAWALEHLGERITVGDLARQAFMTPRTFSRHFRAATGCSPVSWLLDQRVQATLPMLESTSAPVEEIAATVGFANASALRYHFARVMDMRPTEYRRRFTS